MAEELSMGILIDVVDDEWSIDIVAHDDLPLPPLVAAKTDDPEDSNEDTQIVNSDTWRDLALGTQ